MIIDLTSQIDSLQNTLFHTLELEKIKDSCQNTSDLEMEKIKLSHALELEKIRLTYDSDVQKMKTEYELRKTDKNTNPRPHSTNEIHVKLPKLDFDKFSGDVLLWQEFWDSFDSAINSNDGLRDVDKLNYLQAKLEGKAKSVISGLQVTNHNYNVAIQLLK